jgi:hypothetical protein
VRSDSRAGAGAGSNFAAMSGRLPRGGSRRCVPGFGDEEDYLCAYGYVPETTSRLLHPRTAKRLLHPKTSKTLSKAEQKVLELVCAQPKMHPRALESALGPETASECLGGCSKTTTRALEALHYRGLLRVAGRENGIRLYQTAREQQEYLAPEVRLRKLVLLIAAILAPVPERSLRAALQHLTHAAPRLEGRPPVLKELLAVEDLRMAEVKGVRYVWPSGELIDTEAPEQGNERGQADAVHADHHGSAAAGCHQLLPFEHLIDFTRDVAGVLRPDWSAWR